jgi:putative FmdB family regulatory protein
MPLYEYRCPECGLEFEELRAMAEAGPAACPGCGATATRRLSPFAAVTQGCSTSSGGDGTDFGSGCSGGGCRCGG